MTTANQPESGFLETNGAKLYYEVTGEGHPVVLMHAGVADHTMWEGQMDAFSRKYRVIRYDSRCFGKSKTEDVEYSDRQDLYDLLKHLGVEKAHLIGVSRSGQIATDFTLEHPEMVSALVPVAAGLSGFGGQPNEAEMALFEEGEAAEEAHDWAKVAALDVRIWGDGPEQPEGRFPKPLREKMWQMCYNTYSTHTVDRPSVPLEPRAAGRLSEIKVPTLIIYSDFDVSPVAEAAAAMEAGIEGAKRVLISGTAHMIPMEKPEEFNNIVLDFLEQVDRSLK
jgi:3-oxoadipate enol-lactonase